MLLIITQKFNRNYKKTVSLNVYNFINIFTSTGFKNSVFLSIQSKSLKKKKKKNSTSKGSNLNCFFENFYVKKKGFNIPYGLSKKFTDIVILSFSLKVVYNKQGNTIKKIPKYCFIFLSSKLMLITKIIIFPL